MKYSGKYKYRHGYANFINKTFGITNGKDDTTIDCTLIKVPTYSYTRTYREKISEGNGWYSQGDIITEKITEDKYWLVILDGECLGVIVDNPKHKGKIEIKTLSGLKYVKEFFSTI